jgi:uncharacterized membrane protein YgdD (TMEM256/DUF423 family)
LGVLLGQVERYYWVMVAVAGTVTVATGLAAVSLWRRRASGDSRLRFMRRTLSIVLALTAALLLVAAAASVLAAVEPSSSLLVALGLT